MRVRFILAFAIVQMVFPVLFAEASEMDSPTGELNSSSDCVVEDSEGEDAVGAPRADEFSAKLDRCGGVLEPKPAGDTGLVQPPKEGGETPVIPPEALRPE